MRRGRSGQPLSQAQVARNHDLSLTRRNVEALFGTLKRSYGFHRAPYFSLPRNAVACALACMAFNLRRWRVCAAG